MKDLKSLFCSIARKENIDQNKLEEKIGQGKIVIPLNIKRRDITMPTAIGEDLSVKVNANIGGSPGLTDVSKELEKLIVAIKSGADTVMDLTIGKEWKEVLNKVLEKSVVPVGTVPVYAAICENENPEDISADDFIRFIEMQAVMGVDFMTIHAGITTETVEVYNNTGRLGGIVSRGGKIIYRWIKKNKKENPLYEYFDEILNIAEKYNVTLSLGDGFRPGCLADASDASQFSELSVLGSLVGRCRKRKVDVMIEGPGHVPLNLIEENVIKEKKICDGAPFYVLGPLTTDIGAGYDHITGAIGGAVAAWYGADFLCYLTPAEHLHLPEVEDVRQGVIATKIAAHCGSIARGIPGIRQVDDEMSAARRILNWDDMEKFAIDPELVERMRKEYPQRVDRACTMCGEYCALLE